MARRLTDAEILAQIPAARARAKAADVGGLHATSVRYDRTHHRILLELTNGYLIGVPVQALPHLASATRAQLADVELSPEGGGLHFPALDADYSVPALVLAMTAREIGQRGGRAKTTAKTDAARANGTRGGRPRKTAA
jgi:hypothetical protein